MPESRGRLIILQLARLVFALLTAGAVAAIVAYSFDGANRQRFISQMNDAGDHGGLIMGLVMGAAAVASVIATLHGRRMAAILRLVIAGLLYVLMTTKASSGDHLLAYAVVVLLYGTITVFTVMALADHHDVFVGMSFLFGLMALVVMLKFLVGGPEGQKVALIVFLLIECLTIFICFPRRLAWFVGLDGT